MAPCLAGGEPSVHQSALGGSEEGTRCQGDTRQHTLATIMAGAAGWWLEATQSAWCGRGDAGEAPRL